MLIRDFGPIRRASISLRPLTIFVGKNNTGKSHAAMLAHSLISTKSRLGQIRGPPSRPPRKSKIIEGVMRSLEREVRALKPGEEAACPAELASHMVRSCAGRYRTLLENEIVRSFGSEMRELSRSGGGRFSLSLRDGKGAAVTYRNGRAAFKFAPMISIVFRKAKESRARPARFDRKSRTVRCAVAKGGAGQAEGGCTWPAFCAGLDSAIAGLALSSLPAESAFIPAARSGILQAHRAIASNTGRNAPCDGIGGIGVPRLSGAASDLVSAMIGAREAGGAHRGTGRGIEADVLGGRVGRRCADPGAVPEVLYGRSPPAIPIHRASSAVSELAPLTLHLRHRAAKHSALFIEEPEAHLHPGSQAALAGHIVKLVRDGAGVVIATHSAALFEAISQYLQAGPLRPGERRSALGRGDLYLREDEVAPHLFRADGDGEGSVVERIRASAREGIDQEEFVKEDRLLNENNMRIGMYSS